MTDDLYNDITLEKAIAAKFGINMSIDSVIARHFPVSRSSQATLFLSDKKQLYLFVEGKQQLTLGDIKKIVSNAGLKAHGYLPPKDWPTYFDDIGTEKFRQVFPGRHHVSAEDIAFYRTLVPYNPALVLIAEVTDGVVRQFDSDNTSKWRSVTKFTYRRIKTS